MARNVFYSFHYQNDISRVMVVRNRWVTKGGQTISGIIDHAEFEKVQRNGDAAIKKWIKSQLDRTTVTVVLIGAETLSRAYVQYEICESLKRGNAVVGVYINQLQDLKKKTSAACKAHTVIGKCDDGTPVYFDDIAQGIYDYVIDNGYENLGTWVESAVKSMDKNV